MTEETKFKPKKDFLDEDGNVAANYFETIISFDENGESISGKFLTLFDTDGETFSMERSIMEKLYLFLQDIIMEEGFTIEVSE